MSWPLVAIKEVAKVVTGKTPSTVDDQNFGGDIPFVTPAELGLEAYVTSTPRTLSAKGASAIKLVPKNAVMVCCIGSLGKMAIAGTPVATNQQINSVIFDENRVDAKYGFYALQLLKPKMEAMAPSTTVAIVNKGNFEAMQIPLPPLPEQKRIAAILDKADAIRRKRQQAIQLADDFLRAVFLDMFGDPVTNPKGWNTLSLGSLVKKPITYGILKPEDYVEYGIPMLRIQDLKGGIINEDDSFHLITEKLSSQYKRTILEGGEIVISLVGTVGLVAKVPSSLSGANVHRNLGVISLRDDELSEYLCSLMQLPDFMVILDRVTKGGVHRLLNLADLKDVCIPVPGIDLIRSFTKLKDSVRSMCVLSKLCSEEFIFESLSQKAFSGQL